LFAHNVSLNRHIVRSVLFQAMPFWFMPTYEELLGRWWVSFTTNLFRAAGWNMEGGKEGDNINDPYQLDLPDFLEDPAYRLAVEIEKDKVALRRRVQEKIEALDLDLDADDVVEELLRRAAA
jgi:hypothetical protein